MIKQRPEGQLLRRDSNKPHAYGSHIYMHIHNMKLFPIATKGKVTSSKKKKRKEKKENGGQCCEHESFDSCLTTLL